MNPQKSRLDTVVLTATIAITKTDSNILDVRGRDYCQVHFPAAFDGATVSIIAAPTQDGTYIELQDDAGAQITLTKPTTLPGIASFAAPAKAIAFAGCAFIKIVSASSETAERILTVVVS